MKHWPAVQLSMEPSIQRISWEIFCARAVEAGCIGYEESDTEGDSAPHSATLYFPAHEDGRGPDWAGQVRTLAASTLGAKGYSVTGRELEDRDWNERWREHYHLLKAGKRAYIGPPEEAKLPPGAPRGAVVIAIEYSQAFGTGSHASTRGCVQMLEDLAPHAGSVLDIGTGTGVLCFAAIKLGCKYAVGMDSDPVCESSFERNAALNGCSGSAHFVLGSTVDAAVAGCLLAARPIPGLIVCNMLSDHFEPLLPALKRLRKPLVLSGFLLSEAEPLRARLTADGWRISQETDLEEWGTWLVEGS
ncbi:50S ribosomal protein L11 methyltransferase [Candidatus Poribacteria bacterium]|nr:50S ribosomal protein L11 methyltransferase [Candidatus Poribacteria bacterium]